MADLLASRRKERAQLQSLAADYVERLSRRIPMVAAAVVGSVARGDFNLWSDVDVVVVAAELPERAPDRALILAEDAPPGVQPVGFTPAEFARALARANPLAREAIESGIVLQGEEFFAQARRPA